ncbi:MAG: hypothetical protein AAGI38_03225 [Bacteroidota bacterium]
MKQFNFLWQVIVIGLCGVLCVGCQPEEPPSPLPEREGGTQQEIFPSRIAFSSRYNDPNGFPAALNVSLDEDWFSRNPEKWSWKSLAQGYKLSVTDPDSTASLSHLEFYIPVNRSGNYLIGAWPANDNSMFLQDQKACFHSLNGEVSIEYLEANGVRGSISFTATLEKAPSIRANIRGEFALNIR